MSKKLWITLLASVSLIASSIPVSASASTNFYSDVLALQNKSYKVIHVDTISSDNDATDEIQSALDQAKNSTVPIKVIVKEGNYTLKHALVIRSNTWLQTSKNTVFTRPAGFKNIMLLNGDPDKRSNDQRIGSGWRGNSNIIIDGGIWDSNGDAKDANGKTNQGLASGFGLALGQNILVQNVTIKDMVNSHAIDLVGDKNVVVRYSKFLGYKDTTTTKNRGYVEMIQVDGHFTNSSFGIFGAYTKKEVRNGTTVYVGDKTATENIRVEYNFFGNSGTSGMTASPVGIGSHSGDNTHIFQNIDIIGNTFSGNTFAGVHPYNWKNAKIIGNTFTGTQKGVWVDHTTKMTSTSGTSEIQYRPSSVIYIQSNKFQNIKDVAIHLDGEKTIKRKNLDLSSPIRYVKVLYNTFDTTNKAKKIRVSDTQYLQTDLGVFYVVFDTIIGGTKAKTADIEITNLLKKKGYTKSKVDRNVLAVKNFYRVKTKGYNTSATANERINQIKKIGNLPYKGFVEKTNGKYYGYSYAITYDQAVNLSNKVDKQLGTNTSVIKSSVQYAVVDMKVGPFVSEQEALDAAKNLNLSKYGWKYNVKTIIK